MELWFKAFQHQWKFWEDLVPGLGASVDTIFFGGGTPSLLPDSLLAQFFEFLQSALKDADVREFTVECNPETLTSQKLKVFQAGGVDRLSVGIQSFQDPSLVRLERQARAVDNHRSLKLLSDQWPRRWSMDLMFGLPGQSLDLLKQDLEQAFVYAPKHLSIYQLTLTTARSQSWEQPQESVLSQMDSLVEDVARRQGLERYEVSNFAAPGQESHHNLKYWNLEPFLGLGPGASGLLSPWMLSTKALESESHWTWGAQQKNPDRFETWVHGAGRFLAERQALSPRKASDHLQEQLMMGLRLRRGLSRARFGPLDARLEPLWAAEKAAGNIDYNQGFVWMTPRGLQILDHLLPRYFAWAEKAGLPALDSERWDPTFQG
jgi:oxygen-independent coproporphyrinogen-3 oxidase